MSSGDRIHRELDTECVECGSDDVFSEYGGDGDAIIKCRGCGKIATSGGFVA